MVDFLVALALVFVLEGIVFAASPALAKRAIESALATPDATLRVMGLVSALLGLVAIWLFRG